MLNFFKADKFLSGSMMAEMKVRMVVKDNGKIWILHDTKLRAPVSALEFFADSGDIYINYADGTIQHLGVTIPAGARRQDIQDSHAVWFYELDGKEKVAAWQEAPVITADRVIN
jgi:hypothetical protein